MTNLIIIFLIYIIMLGTDKVKEKARTVVPIVLGVLLVIFTVGSLINGTPNYLLSDSSDFLTIVLVFIMLFEVDKFKSKGKIVLLGILGVIMSGYLVAKLVNFKLYLSMSDWNNIINSIGLLCGIFYIIHMITIFIKKK